MAVDEAGKHGVLGEIDDPGTRGIRAEAGWMASIRSPRTSTT